MHTHLGVLGVVGFLMKTQSANPLDYVEGGALTARRLELSSILDATNPDLGAFAKRGGKMIVTIGTNDTLASPGAQLDYYASVVQTMGRATVDRFARLFVMPPAGQWPERDELPHGWQRQDDRGDADSEPVRPVGTAVRLGGKGHRAADVR